jgi:hypothetical protein
VTTLNLPTHVATSVTAATVTVAGLRSTLHFRSAPSSAAIWVRGDGVTAVAGADYNYPVWPSPDEGTCVPIAGGTTTSTSFSVIAASGTPTVSVLPCDCDDDD